MCATGRGRGECEDGSGLSVRDSYVADGRFRSRRVLRKPAAEGPGDVDIKCRRWVGPWGEDVGTTGS